MDGKHNTIMSNLNWFTLNRVDGGSAYFGADNRTEAPVWLNHWFYCIVIVVVSFIVVLVVLSPPLKHKWTTLSLVSWFYLFFLTFNRFPVDSNVLSEHAVLNWTSQLLLRFVAFWFNYWNFTSHSILLSLWFIPSEKTISLVRSQTLFLRFNYCRFTWWSLYAPGYFHFVQSFLKRQQ